MSRRRMSTTRRARIFEAHKGVCHICGLKIATGEPWEAEHIVPLGLSDDDSDDNLAPAHTACHSPKTSADITQIAKAKRVRAKHIGAWRPKSVLPGSRKSKWKRLIGGCTVRRDK